VGLQEKLLQPSDYHSIENACDYVDLRSDTIPPLWAVMDKSAPLLRPNLANIQVETREPYYPLGPMHYENCAGSPVP
jgi:hypothetical protein